MHFEFIEIEYNKLDITNGEYISINNNKILDTKNYIFLKGSLILGFYISEFFSDDDFSNKDLIHLLTKNIPTTQNRSDIGGKIDTDKMFDCYKQYINSETKYNKNNTRVMKTDKVKYSFSNNTKSKLLNKENSILKKLVKKVSKITKKFFSIQETDKAFECYSHCIINKQLRSAIHQDSNNKKDSLSALISLSMDKKLKKSYLNLVDLDLSIPMISNRSLLVFPLVDFRHSNNFIKEKELEERISIVFFDK